MNVALASGRLSSATADRSADGALVLVQALRGIAALMVVFHHVIRAFTINAPAGWVRPFGLDVPLIYETLAIGVDLFFVISGFIMVHAGNRFFSGAGTAREFLLRRITRIYPAYWVITSILVGGMVFQWIWSGRASADLSFARLVGSFTLFPTFNQQNLVQPILGVGWTLTYEMYFYMLFALTVLIFRRNFLLPMLGLIGGFILVGRLGPQDSAIVQFLANPVALEFVLGCLVARFMRGFSRPVMPLLIAGSSVIALVTLMAILGADDGWRWVFWGIPSALLVYSAVSLERTRRVRCPAMLRHLGDASYSIYLVHVPIIYLIGLKLVTALRLEQAAPALMALVVFGVAAMAVFAGLIYYRLVEQPLEAKFKAARQKQPALSAPKLY